MVNADGTGEHQIQPHRGGLFPDWSPTADRIAMSTLTAAGTETIITVDPSGRNARDLHASGECSEWSSDGSKMMYWHQTHSPQGFDLYVMDADGSGLRGLTTDPRPNAAQAWLPDGRIVFATFVDDGPRPEWFVMDADGSGTRSIAQLNGAGEPLDWLP